jgi:hypothetical protein
VQQGSDLFYQFSSATINDKTDKRFGQKLAEEILSLIKDGGDNYFIKRNAVIEKNRQFLHGEQPMSEYLDLIGIDGKQSYVNLDMEAPDTAAPFVERIVARCMERDERPTVRCVDDESLVERQRRKDEAEFRMKMAQQIQQFQEQAGVPLEAGDAFVPENMEDLELWAETEDRLPEEVAFERKIFDVMMDSGYDIFKRRVLNDICAAGYGVARVFLDSNRNIKYEFIAPEDMYWTYSNYDDFRDATIMGHKVKVKVSAFRMMYPGVKEEDVHRLYVSSRQDSNAYTGFMEWDYSYGHIAYRPYDDALIELFMFEYVTTDAVSYVKKVTRSGREVLKRAKGKVEEAEMIVKRQAVVYKGCYALGANVMVEWGPMENMIKPMNALHEVFTSYVVIMPNQNRMVVKPLVSRMIRHIRQMTISLLKLQQLKSQMKPDEAAINISTLQDIDLGLGRIMTPFDIQQIYDQTGKLYYKGVSDDDERQLGVPITPMPISSTPAKMQALMVDYNFHLENMRQDIGTNEVADGQGFNSKLGLGVQNNLIGTSNRSTEFVYNGFVSMMEGIAKRVAVLMWYNVVNGGGYAKDMDVDKTRKRAFDIQISMLPTEVERAYVQEITTSALAKGSITYDEAFKVRRLSGINVKLAELYLSKYERKRQEQARMMQEENIRMTAEAQQASNQQTADNNSALQQMKGQMDIKKQEAVNMGSRTQQMGEIVKVILENPIALQTLGPRANQLFDAYFANLGGTQVTEIAANQQLQQNMVQAQQQQAAEEQAMMAEQEAQAQQEQAQNT